MYLRHKKHKAQTLVYLMENGI